MTRVSEYVDGRVPCLGASRAFYRVALGEPGRRVKCRDGALTPHPDGRGVEAARHIVRSSN